MARECGTESGNEKFKVTCLTDFSFYKRAHHWQKYSQTLNFGP
jgi:hypothetical protein